MPATAAIYDALKHGKSVVLAEKYAIWTEHYQKSPSFIVTELLPNGRTKHLTTELDFIALITFLENLGALSGAKLKIVTL